jgi:hypothetical protein
VANATLSRVVLDRLGNEVMIVHPDYDSQLSDPAFAPVGTQQYDVPYRGWTTQRELLVLIQQKVSAAGRVILAALIQKRIDLIDAFTQLGIDRDLYATRVAQWPSPTQAQQLLINAALAKVVTDLQTIQGIRDDIQTLLGQLP